MAEEEQGELYEVRQFSSYEAMKTEEGSQRVTGTEAECQKWVSARWASKGEVFWAVGKVE